MPVEIKGFAQFLAEQKQHVYEYGCAMLYFDFPEIEYIHEKIDPNDVYEDPNDDTYGLEKEPHTTLLFGIHSNEVDDAKVMEICKSRHFGEMTLHNPSIFENEKYDVLKFDVKNESLNGINKELKKLPFTNEYKDYHPHATIAYMKKGSAKKYADRLKGAAFKVKPSSIVYSKPDGTKLSEPWS